MTVRLPMVVTFSKADIARRCGWAMHNPCVEPAEGGSAQQMGSDAHAYVEQSLSGVVMDESSEGAALGKGCVEEICERTDPYGRETIKVYSEMTTSWDAFEWKGQLVGEHLNRQYPEGQPKHILYGTGDLAYMEQDGTLVNIDLKSNTDGTEFAEDHSQLMLGTLSLASALGAKKVRAELWGMRWYKRPWIESATYTFPQMYALAQEIEDNVRNEQATAVPGQHCKWCPANGQCPATERALVGLADSPGKWSSDIVGAEHASWMIERLPLVKKALENIEKELKAYSDKVGGVELSDGKVYKSGTFNRSSFNATAAKAKLEQLGVDLGEFTHNIEVTQYRARKP